jgi:hypothetical protein
MHAYTGSHLQRWNTIELEFFRFCATGNVDKFCEAGLVPWNFLHNAVCFGTRVDSLKYLRAGTITFRSVKPELVVVHRFKFHGCMLTNGLDDCCLAGRFTTLQNCSYAMILQIRIASWRP